MSMNLCVCPYFMDLFGRTENAGRDDPSAVIVHAGAWDGTRFLTLVWLTLIPSLVNIHSIAAGKSGVLGLRFCVLSSHEFGKGVPSEPCCEFPSNVLCPARCISSHGKVCCSLPHAQYLNSCDVSGQQLAVRKLPASISCKWDRGAPGGVTPRPPCWLVPCWS